MALQSINGVYYPPFPVVAVSGPTFASVPIDATGEKFAWCGRVWNPSRASMQIHKVHFLTGTISNTNGQNMVLSLQALDAANGARPDEVQLNTATFADTGLASDTWFTATLASDKTVVYGEKLAVVLEYSSFSGTTVVNLKNVSVGTGAAWGGAWCTAKVGAGPTWGTQTTMPNVILEDVGGSLFGTLGPPGTNFVATAITTGTSINTGTTPDEIGLAFTVPVACVVEGAWFMYSTGAASRDFEIGLYSGAAASSSLITGAKETFDAEQVSGTGRIYHAIFGTPATLSTGTQYWLSIKPTTASSNNYPYFDVSAAAHLVMHGGGSDMCYATRTDAGTWTTTTTRRPIAGLILSQLHDGAASSSSYVIGG